MGIIELRRRIMLLSEQGQGPTPTPTIGGLPVWMDNSRYTSSDGAADSVVIDSDFFLTGVVDAGSPDFKSYTVTRFHSSTNAALRLFNDVSATSVDYWTIMRTDISPGDTNIYGFNSFGRYIIMSIYKPVAADFYLKDANGNYLIKGSNVT